MFFIAYTFKGQVNDIVFAGRVKIVSHLSCRTGTISKYFCPPIGLPCNVPSCVTAAMLPSGVNVVCVK